MLESHIVQKNRSINCCKKQDLLKYSEVKWHLIGNLQRRKVKLIVNKIDYFHALDS